MNEIQSRCWLERKSEMVLSPKEQKKQHRHTSENTRKENTWDYKIARVRDVLFTSMEAKDAPYCIKNKL